MQGGAEKTAYFLHVYFLIHISFTFYISILKTWRKKKKNFKSTMELHLRTKPGHLYLI